VLCTTIRAKKIVICLTVFTLIAQAVNVPSWYLAPVIIIDSIFAIVFRVLVPATVLVINVMVVREVRRRASNTNSLGLQPHHKSTSSNSAVPTVMLLTTSLVYVLLCGTSSVLYVINDWTLMLNPYLRTNDLFLFQFHMFASPLSLLVFAYNFYVYLITGKEFRSEVCKLFRCCCFSSVGLTDGDAVERPGHACETTAVVGWLTSTV